MRIPLVLCLDIGVKFICSHSFTLSVLHGGILRMRWARFILFGMLLFSLIAVNFITPVSSDGPDGTRSPGADVTLSTLTANQTAKPTDSLSYVFVVNNTGDEMDNFTVTCISVHDWLVNWSSIIVGPLKANESAEVVVNVTVPMGTPANTQDNITFTAQSNSDFGVIEEIMVNTTVMETFIISIDIQGDYERSSSIDPPSVTNYTLTIKNKGNDEITITLKYSTPAIGWSVSFPQFPNGKVKVGAANSTHPGSEQVNVSISAPLDATPGFEMSLTLWGERTDAFPIWYSFQDQENITLKTIVKSKITLELIPDIVIGYAGLNDTIYNFTMQNLGNTDVVVDFIPVKDGIIGVVVNIPRVNLREGELPIINRIFVSTASNAPLGNYTINISAINNITGEFIDSMIVNYVIVPVLNITNLSISDSKPLQYEQSVLTVTIENIGFINAVNVTVKFFDGDDRIGEVYIPSINISETEIAKLNWTPAHNGNRSVRVVVSVEGVGNFSEHGTGIAEKKANFDVKINWKPYYLVIYIIIIIILGIGVVAGLNELRYYSGVPSSAGLGEDEEVEEGLEVDYTEEDLPPMDEKEGMEQEERRPFGTYGVTTQRDSLEPVPPRTRYESQKEYAPPPGPRSPPPRRDFSPPKDPETLRQEGQVGQEMAKVQEDIDRLKSQGVDTSSIDQLLRTSKKNLSEGDITKAKQYLGYASERLKNLMAKREEAVIAIREAKEVLSGMRGSADLTIVENFIVKADSLLNEGDFREAINYAKKAKDRAQRLQRKEMRL